MNKLFRKVTCPVCQAEIEEMLWEEGLWRGRCQCGSEWFTEEARRAVVNRKKGKTMLLLCDDSAECRAIGEELTQRCRASPIAKPTQNGNGQTKSIGSLLSKEGKYAIDTADIVMAIDNDTKAEFVIWGKEDVDRIMASDEAYAGKMVVVLYAGDEELRWLNLATHILKGT